MRGAAAVSPDGKYVAYSTLEAGKETLWVKQISTGSTVQVAPPVEAGHRSLAFSKDGDYLYFVRWEMDRSHALYRMPALGGPARKLIADVDGWRAGARSCRRRRRPRASCHRLPGCARR